MLRAGSPSGKVAWTSLSISALALAPLISSCGQPQCTSALDCPAETTCILSRCRPAPCVSDTECGGSASCIGGLCTQTPGSTPTPGGRDAGAARDGGTPSPRDSGLPGGGGSDSGVPGGGADAGTGGGPDATARPSDIIQIVAVDTENCALFQNGQVRCWGENDSGGALGNGTAVGAGGLGAPLLSASPAVDLGSGGTAVAISMSCAVLTGGRLKCWGKNGTGQLGLGDQIPRGTSPSQLGNALPAINLGSGVFVHQVAGSPIRGTVCALVNQGAVKCWGDNNLGTVGDGLEQFTIGTVPKDMGDNLPYLDFGIGNVPVEVAVANKTACARMTSGDVQCWGDQRGGAVGSGHLYGYFYPSRAIDLGTGRKAIKIAGGDGQMCAILDNQALKCWGTGALGLGDNLPRGLKTTEMGDNLPAIDLGTGVHAVDVATSGDHTCAVLDSGYVKCWGHNNNGQLGVGDTNDRGWMPNQMGDALPVIQLDAFPATQVSAGNVHSCALFASGRIKCWGNYESLGYGDANSRGKTSATMGTALPYLDFGLIPINPPDAGVLDSGVPVDAGTPDAGPPPVPVPDTFDPTQGYFWGILPDPTGSSLFSPYPNGCNGDTELVLYTLSAPKLALGGLPCNTGVFMINPRSGRATYLDTQLHAVREFHCDTCDLYSWRPFQIDYPWDPGSNDSVIPTPRCTTSTNAVSWFTFTPEGNIRYACGGTTVFDETGNVVPLPAGSSPSAFGTNGRVLARAPLNAWPTYIVDGHGNTTPITGQPTDPDHIAAARAQGAGFRVATVNTPQHGNVDVTEVWSISASGVATMEAGYGAIPATNSYAFDLSGNLLTLVYTTTSASVLSIAPNGARTAITVPRTAQGIFSGP